MLVTLVAATGIAAAAGLPVDRVRRRHPSTAAFAAGLVNAAVLVAAVALLARTPLLADARDVVGVVLGLVAGSVAADAAATRLWGPSLAR